MNAAYRHNGELVGRDAFYAIACDPQRSVAVEACAGAGKTWMLVSRILRALMEGAQPHEILAITFTRKAAGEMRGRLHEWLSTFARAPADSLKAELVVRGISNPTDAQAEALAGLYRATLATGRPVQIRTFHSWFSALLRTAPLAVLDELGLPSGYELLEDDTQAKALVWRRFYGALVDNPELHADFQDAVTVHGRSQTRKALETALDKRIEFALADAHGTVDESVRHFSREFAEFAGLDLPEDMLGGTAASRALLADAAIALGRAKAPTFAAKGVELERALTEGDTPAVFAALLTNEGTPRKFGEKIVGIDGIRAAQELVLRVAAAQTQHAAWLHQQRMARLTRLLVASFSALKRERGWVDMNDVERASQRLLGDELLSGWVQEKLDARVRHLLIDEFQDTNPLQWQSLHAWLSSYVGAGTAPSVFLVGDPKQSIYRFRRAEPQVFRAAQAFVGGELGGDRLSCDHTRRNAPPVVALVNSVMEVAAEQDGYDGFRAHTTQSAEPGRVIKLPRVHRAGADGVDVDTSAGEAALGDATGWRDSLTVPRELPEETLRAVEARQAAQWIAQQIAAGAGAGGTGLAPGKVMVLARKRASLTPMLEALRALRIPAQMGEKMALIECAEIQDVVALLDALVSPQHDLSLARALKSPLFGVDDEGLVQLALRARERRAGGGSATWWAVLQQADLPPQLAGIGELLIKYRRWLDSFPPHDALDAIFHDRDVIARFAAAAPAVQRDAVVANLRALLSASLQIDGARYATPYAFVRALKAGGVQSPAVVNRGAVQLLTVHGAKGLEADLVLMLDTDNPERSAETMGVLVDWPGEDPCPSRFVFMASETRPPSCCVGLLEAEQLARRREELNGLYVAMTRARSVLAISSIEPARPAPGSWWVRMEALCSESPHAASAATAGPRAVKPGEAPATFTLPVLPDVAIAQVLEHPTSSAQGAVDDADGDDSPDASIGKALHRLLQWGAPTGGRFNDMQIRAAAREFGLAPAQSARAADMAHRILRGPGAWAFDKDAINWQGNEVPLSHEGQSFRLDRLVRRRSDGAGGHEWWVLDYKSATRPLQKPELAAQLAGYRTAVQAIHPGEVVKAAFLTGLGELVLIE
ncbi:MAG: DNA helicase UvrD [Comamonadaceae bacterium]|nr:MAG: DNA helicase UvrD [Comamonadaceae bacterium]